MEYSKKFVDILNSRGIVSEGEIESYLHPSFDTLEPLTNYSNMLAAKDRIERALSSGESIIIYGDYDADGVCSVAMLYDFLARKGANVSYFIPDRHRDGYGINMDQIEYLATNYFPDLIITVDLGISSHDDIEIIENELGIDVIVTDHHEPPGLVPECIVVDPKIDADKGVYLDYSGAGVVFRLIESLSDLDTAMDYLDICTISTIGDIVPLGGDNRVIASHGLPAITNTKRLGLKLLIESIVKGNVTSYDVSFKIVPRINSMGRLGDANKVVELFLSDDYFMMKTLVEELESTNLERQKMTDEVIEDALAMLENIDLSGKSAIVLAGDHWDSGVIGIAASKLVGIFNRPTILLARDDNGEYKGSCRSIHGVNLYGALSSMSELFSHFGGHKMACGLSIAKANIKELEVRLNEIVSIDTTLNRVDKAIDIDMSDISVTFSKELAMMEPFGEGNPEPIFTLRDSSLTFSRIAKSDHIKAKPSNDFEMLYFNGIKNIDVLNQNCVKEYTVKIKHAIYKNFDYAQAVVRNVVVDIDNNYNDEKVISRYLKNLLRDRDSIFKIEDFCDDTLKDSAYGTLLVAFNKDTYLEYMARYKGYLYRFDAENIDDINPLNAIALGINVTDNLRYYRNIVFLDDIMHYNIVDYLKLSGDARIFRVQCNANIKNRIVLPSYARLGDIFRAIRQILVERPYGNNIDELYLDVCKKIDTEYLEFSIAFFTFFDLGIIRINASKNIVIDRSVNTKLEQSEFYAELKEMVDDGE